LSEHWHRAGHQVGGDETRDADHGEAAIPELALLVGQDGLGGGVAEAEGVQAKVCRESTIEPPVATLEITLAVVGHGVDLYGRTGAEDLRDTIAGYLGPCLGRRHGTEVREFQILSHREVAGELNAC